MNTTLRSVLCVLALVPLLSSCGNKGDLTLEPGIVSKENLDILKEPLPDPADTEDEEKPAKKPQ